MSYVKVPTEYLEELIGRANKPVPQTDNRPWEERNAEIVHTLSLECKVERLQRDRDSWAKSIEAIESGEEFFHSKVTRLDVMRDALRFFDAALATEYVPVTVSTSCEYLNVSGPGYDDDWIEVDE